jgi:hypothetical protein
MDNRVIEAFFTEISFRRRRRGYEGRASSTNIYSSLVPQDAWKGQDTAALL